MIVVCCLLFSQPTRNSRRLLFAYMKCQVIAGAYLTCPLGKVDNISGTSKHLARDGASPKCRIAGHAQKCQRTAPRPGVSSTALTAVSSHYLQRPHTASQKRLMAPRHLWSLHCIWQSVNRPLLTLPYVSVKPPTNPNEKVSRDRRSCRAVGREYRQRTCSMPQKDSAVRFRFRVASSHND